MKRGLTGLVLLLGVALAGCDPEPGGEPAPDPTATTTAPSPASSPALPASPAVSPPAPGSPPPGSPATWWKPTAGTPWQWQLDGSVDSSIDVPIYDVDGFETTAAQVSALHAAGRKVICYINAGASENFRSDHATFPASVQGRGVEGWPGEKWLDVRRIDVLRPIMAARFDMCRAKGFDGVEPDLMDGYANNTGFPLTAAHQLAYNRMLLALGHERGLAVGLKNDLDQVAELADEFDFAVNEECFAYDECSQLTPFIKLGKPVFHVEYELATSEFCADARRLGFSSMRKRLDLDAWRQPC